MALIYINRSDSRCGACGESASMRETGHFSVLGYTPGKGCGAIWDGVSSDYTHIPEILAAGDTGYFFAENLRGLPVYGFIQDEPIGVYGGTAEQNGTLF
jgi:hypothetical protein